MRRCGGMSRGGSLPASRWRRWWSMTPGSARTGRRERAGIPDEVRHTEKWRLALEMIDEMTDPGGWGVLEQVTAAGGGRPVVVADAGYGEGADFRQELDARGWRYVIAVKGTVSA